MQRSGPRLARDALPPVDRRAAGVRQRSGARAGERPAARRRSFIGPRSKSTHRRRLRLRAGADRAPLCTPRAAGSRTPARRVTRRASLPRRVAGPPPRVPWPRQAAPRKGRSSGQSRIGPPRAVLKPLRFATRKRPPALRGRHGRPCGLTEVEAAPKAACRGCGPVEPALRSHQGPARRLLSRPGRRRRRVRLRAARMRRAGHLGAGFAVAAPEAPSRPLRWRLRRTSRSARARLRCAAVAPATPPGKGPTGDEHHQADHRVDVGRAAGALPRAQRRAPGPRSRAGPARAARRGHQQRKEEKSSSSFRAAAPDGATVRRGPRAESARDRGACGLLVLARPCQRPSPAPGRATIARLAGPMAGARSASRAQSLDAPGRRPTARRRGRDRGDVLLVLALVVPSPCPASGRWREDAARGERGEEWFSASTAAARAPRAAAVPALSAARA